MGWTQERPECRATCPCRGRRVGRAWGARGPCAGTEDLRISDMSLFGAGALAHAGTYLHTHTPASSLCLFTREGDEKWRPPCSERRLLNPASPRDVGACREPSRGPAVRLRGQTGSAGEGAGGDTPHATSRHLTPLPGATRAARGLQKRRARSPRSGAFGIFRCCHHRWSLRRPKGRAGRRAWPVWFCSGVSVCFALFAPTSSFLPSHSVGETLRTSTGFSRAIHPS